MARRRSEAMEEDMAVEDMTAGVTEEAEVWWWWSLRGKRGGGVRLRKRGVTSKLIPTLIA